ncbi:MAG: hypothetical protein ACLSVD_16375 [Eggerthellaceae bacterium]
MHVDTDDLATLLKMQHLDLEAMRDKKKLEELPQRAVILEARSKKKAIEQKRAQLDALHAKADAQLSRIDDEDRSLSEKQRQVQSEIDAVRGDYAAWRRARRGQRLREAPQHAGSHRPPSATSWRRSKACRRRWHRR